MTEESDKYRDDYIRESKEHLNSLNDALLTLEKYPGHAKSIDSLFRHAHTLKSMSAIMRLTETEQLCHALEDVLDKIKKQQINSKDCINELFKACDSISKITQRVELGKSELSTRDITNKLIQLSKQQREQSSNNELIDDTVVHQIEKVRSINVKVDRLDRLMNLSEEFLINKMQLDVLQENMNQRELKQSIENLNRLIADLQFLVVQARLVPLDYIFNRFPRMVRDLAKKSNKNIDIQMRGGAIELDRAIIDELGECLVHLLRNAIGHGIESKEVRQKVKKFDMATLAINAYRQRNMVVIEISDDGGGLPIDVLAKNARAKHLIGEQATQSEIIETVFSGISSSKKVSKVSGRGFGLKIVKQKVESLGGRITMKSMSKRGTTFALELPLSLAIIRVLFVESNHIKYAIPIANIIRLVKLPKHSVKKVMKHEAIVLDGEEIPVTRLSRVFNKPELEQDKVSIVIIKYKNRMLGILVDAFSNMQDVVIKPLNRAVRKNRYFSGSTVVGSGAVVLILDVMNISASDANYEKTSSHTTGE